SCPAFTNNAFTNKRTCHVPKRGRLASTARFVANRRRPAHRVSDLAPDIQAGQLHWGESGLDAAHGAKCQRRHAGDCKGENLFPVDVAGRYASSTTLQRGNTLCAHNLSPLAS